jgi:IS30 family transposase
MQLRARGWSILSAAREVGVSRTAGNNWSRGYKVYRLGAVVKVVAPLDRFEVRKISARYLSLDERILIADLRHTGMTIRAIAEETGRAPSTISRELRRNGRLRGSYRPFEAHKKATGRRARHPARRLQTNVVLRRIVGERLAVRWSPAQISRHLRGKFPGRPEMWLCHESIYRAVYEPGSSLVRPSGLAPHRSSPLRTGRDHRRAHQKTHRRRPRFQEPVLTIHDRPFAPEDRSTPGEWEGDLIIGKNQGSAIGTLVERTTRTVRLLHLTSRDSETLQAALEKRMKDLPATLLRSITWDQGIEMARHLSIAAALHTKVYFCDAHSPWQRGSNENANGLLRDYFPKGTDLSVYSPEHLLAVEEELNNRPRLVLGDRVPAELFQALLASPEHRVLRR